MRARHGMRMRDDWQRCGDLSHTHAGQQNRTEEGRHAPWAGPTRHPSAGPGRWPGTIRCSGTSSAAPRAESCRCSLTLFKTELCSRKRPTILQVVSDRRAQRDRIQTSVPRQSPDEMRLASVRRAGLLSLRAVAGSRCAAQPRDRAAAALINQPARHPVAPART